MEPNVPEQPTLHQNIPLIEVSEKLILDALIADPVTGQYILNRLSDTVAVVSPGQSDKLFARLRKQGHTPKVIGKSP